MRENGLAGAYCRKRFKVRPGAVNEADVPNVVARGFGGRAPRTHICSDLACVRVGASWNYVCPLVDLCNGEIVGHSAGPRRDARAPSQALGLRALVQQLQDPLDAGLHVAGRVQGGGPGVVQIGVANPWPIQPSSPRRRTSGKARLELGRTRSAGHHSGSGGLLVFFGRNLNDGGGPFSLPFVFDASPSRRAQGSRSRVQGLRPNPKNITPCSMRFRTSAESQSPLVNSWASHQGLLTLPADDEELRPAVFQPA